MSTLPGQFHLLEDRLRRYDPAGKSTTDVPLRKGAEHLALSPSNGNIWVSNGGKLSRMDGKGKPLDHLDLGERARDLAVSPDGFAWVLGKTRLYKVSEDGKVAAKYDLKRQGIAEPRYLALDPAGGFAWVSGDKQIVRVKTNGDQRLTHVRVPKRAAIAGLAANPADGTIYAAGRRSLLVFGRDGRLHRKVELGRYRLGSIGGFAFDAPSSGLWLAGGSKILHFSPTGEVVAELNSSGGVAALGTVAYAAPTRGIEPPEGPSPEAPPEEAQRRSRPRTETQVPRHRRKPPLRKRPTLQSRRLLTSRPLGSKRTTSSGPRRRKSG